MSVIQAHMRTSNNLPSKFYYENIVNVTLLLGLKLPIYQF